MIDASVLDQHERIALNFSGGKDSLACIYLLRPHLHRITVYHNDTGDLLPEVREIVAHAKAMCPKFVHLHGNVRRWITENGHPSDLVPYGSSPFGRMVGNERVRVVGRYDCCYPNLMRPLWEHVIADGNTLVIRGTKRGDFPTLPVLDGQSAEGIRFWYPLQEWSHERVFEYLRGVGAPICRVYEVGLQAPECARCTAWLNVGLGAYLRKHHPDLFDDYRADMAAVLSEIGPSIEHLAAEVTELAHGR